jgi:prepilin-type N-terminal cleavage/methylation domain-containing protein
MRGNRAKMSKQAHLADASHRPKKRAESGMTLIELLVAIAVLTVGMLGSMLLLLAGMQTNSRNRTDTTGTVLDQEIIEEFATLKNYPKPGTVNIYDCSTGSGNLHLASLGQSPGPAGAGAVLDAAGNVDWTQAAPTLATSTTAGYAMRYKTCNSDIYEVRWNVMEVNPNPNSRISLLTVSSRQLAAQSAQAAGRNNAVLYARPSTLRTLIEN